MTLNTTIMENDKEYIFTVADEAENQYRYRFGKQLIENQDLQTYLQNCKREAELLVEHSIKSQLPPQEITIPLSE